MSDAIISKAFIFQKRICYFKLYIFNFWFESSNASSTIFGFISVVGYLLNRSEMWGLFVARYNPTYSELLFGSGPLNFGQLYGEIPVNSPDSFLLPHSSILSY